MARFSYTPRRVKMLTVLLIASVASPLYAQTFTRITAGDVATDTGNTFGAAWVDIDDDGDLDLYVSNAATSLPNFLYRNEGDGTFTKIDEGIILTDLQAAVGTCWADYDNDGDLDVYNAGVGNSFLYRNDGLAGFTKVVEEDIGGASDNRGWSCAWGDADNDGFVDLFVAHPTGFLGPPISNTFFFNDGDGSFTRVTDSPVVIGLAPYTVGNWTDYDDDGDVDLFIGSGPATGTPGPDFLYQNEWTETGAATFARITALPLNEVRDGQTWNFIDYDNDGDLDGFVTNYSGFPNELYRNENGAFVKVTQGPLVTDAAPSLANVWGDFDNDGDLDVIITNEFGFDNVYYRNDGPPGYTFTRTTAFDGTAIGNYGASAGDYDLDGDLDVFIPTHSFGARFFYQTDAPAANHWINLRLVGTASNRSAAGAKVRVQATLGGATVWQRREVSTQNTFNGHNSLNVHVGLGDAAVAEAVEITWPSGHVDVASEVEAGTFYVALEGEGLLPLPNYLILRLMGRVRDLVSAGTLNQGQGNALTVKLRQALQQAAQGNDQAVLRRMKAFLNQVGDLVQAGVLTEEEGRTLSDLTQTVFVVLGGGAVATKEGQAGISLTQRLAEAAPEAFGLHANYPNPFNPSTRITYTVKEEGYISLNIYDMLGRQVATLVDGVKAAGEHQISWDASDLPSGVYLYRLEAGLFVQSRLMHLLK